MFLFVNSWCMSRASGSDPGEPLQLGDHQRGTGSAGGQGQPKPGSVSIRAGQAMIDASDHHERRAREIRWLRGERSCCPVDTRVYPTKGSFIHLR
jgi:hypothetical protein